MTILNSDLYPDRAIRPFMFKAQHSSSSGAEEVFVDEETQEEIQGETSRRYFFIPWSGINYSHRNFYNFAMTVIS